MFGKLPVRRGDSFTSNHACANDDQTSSFVTLQLRTLHVIPLESMLQNLVPCLVSSLKMLLKSVHSIHLSDPIILLALFQLIEILIRVTNFF